MILKTNWSTIESGSRILSLDQATAGLAWGFESRGSWLFFSEGKEESVVVLSLSLGYSNTVLPSAFSGLSKVYISKFLHSCKYFYGILGLH